MHMTGNTMLITGGTSGIGRALAEAFHDLGNTVIIAGRRAALLEEISAQRPGMVGIELDQNDPASLEQLAGQLKVDFPHLNVLFANAGISRAEDMTAPDWNLDAAQDIIETNILGVLRVTHAILPLLKGKPNAAILTTSSNLAFVPRAVYPTYCASKAFLHSWLQSLRHQLRTIPIEVLELAPPYVQSELTGEQQLADPNAMPVAEYVAEVMGLLAAHNHPRGEVLVGRHQERRWAERDRRYEEIFAAMNP